MDPQIVSFLNNRYKPEEVVRITTFLDSFSRNGQIAIVSIFAFAQEAGKSVDEVLSLCEKENQRNWQYQHPDIRGDADAPGAAGLQNRTSLENIYSTLGIKSPMAKRAEIPTKALIVRTVNSVYRLAQADSIGERSITRDKRPLEFTKCKVLDLMIGDQMQLQCFDGPYQEYGFHTSVVVAIE